MMDGDDGGASQFARSGHTIGGGPSGGSHCMLSPFSDRRLFETNTIIIARLRLKKSVALSQRSKLARLLEIDTTFSASSGLLKSQLSEEIVVQG